MTITDPRARREARVDGARIVYAEAGSGEPVVFLHGYPESRLAWRHQFAALARTHRLIAPDWIGWGESDRPLELSYLYDEEVERIGRFLDVVRAPQANLVVHDYGGHLAMGLAARHPERIRRLVVLNSRAQRTFPAAPWLMFAAIGFAARTPGLRFLLERGPNAALHRLLLRGDVRRGVFDRAALDRYLGWMSTPGERRWFVRFWQDYALREPDVFDGLRRFESPTAIVWGDRDPYCPPATAEELARLLPNATLEWLPGARHFVMEERAAEVISAIERLLARPVASARVA
ncbi:MAG: alpha/beta fold hydrolase [Candidatus Binatia bacterium]